MGGDEVDQHEQADRVAAEHGESAGQVILARNQESEGNPDCKTMEIFLLHLPWPVVELGPRADVDQEHRQDDEDHRQLERGEGCEEAFDHCSAPPTARAGANSMDLRKSSKFVFSLATACCGPSILKNQTSLSRTLRARSRRRLGFSG